jgi:hypothetical protein
MNLMRPELNWDELLLVKIKILRVGSSGKSLSVITSSEMKED